MVTRNGIKLDWMCRQILRAIKLNGGVATTTEIKRRTGIEDNAKLLYRYDAKLVEAGLITRRRPKSKETDSHQPNAS